MKDFVYRILTVWVVTSCVCLAAPKPAIVPGPRDWTIDVTFEHPRQILLQPGPGGQNQPGRFWYTILTLTNNVKHDVDFYPMCDLMTDTFQVIPAGKGTLPVVFQQIKNHHRSEYPFLEPLEKLGSKILQGEDNARDVAIIWPDFDTKARGIKLFITGLSNETAVVDHPVARDETGKPIKVYLRKTLELSYTLGGDPAFRSDAGLVYEGKRWVMR